MEKLVGKKLDVSGYDKPKSGRVSKNELCPCGSNKKYKRYFIPFYGSTFSFGVLVYSFC